MAISDMYDSDEEQNLLEKGTAKESEAGDDEDFEMPPEPEVKGPLKPVSECQATEVLAGIFGAAAVGTSIANIVQVGGMWVIIAGGLSTLMGGYLYWQTNRLVDIRSFTEVIAYIRNQIDQIKKNNEELDGVIGGLASNVEKLGNLKSTLDTLTSLGGDSIDEFAESLEISKKNCRKSVQDLRSQFIRIVWDLMDAVDRDRDYMMNEQELESLLEMLREIDGITIYEDRFRERLTNQPIDICEDLVLQLNADKAPPDEILYRMHVYEMVTGKGPGGHKPHD